MPTLGIELQSAPATVPLPVPSAGQREAIEAPAAPLLVLAGPGAGKTFCLIERIRYLIEERGLAPERLCAFTFTNKAAGEIAARLERTLGERATRVKSGTIHAFCAELLREFGERIGLERGFGIADECLQRTVLRRLGIPPKLHGWLLTRFSMHRFRGESLQRRDADNYERYERFLDERTIVDFDMLLLKTRELLQEAHIVARIRARWDCVLVDEFQDLNPVQYAVIRDIGREHRHVFAVGDDEQSIFSWAGADPHVFLDFTNDFGITTRVQLRENRRCPREIVGLARRLVEINPCLFAERKDVQVGRESPNCVAALTFPTDDAEIAWVIEDLQRDRAKHGLDWGDYALLYRKHEIGDAAEAGLLTARLPCRLAHGRALGEDAVVAYVVAALGVIACPDDLRQEAFLEVVLPTSSFDDARVKAEKSKRTILAQLELTARELPREHGDARKIRRGFSVVANLGALGRRHSVLSSLVEELLSQRVGAYRTVLEEHHDVLTDPCMHDEVIALADRLTAVLEAPRPVWLPRLRGVEIALKGMLAALGVRVVLGEVPGDAERVEPSDAPTLGLPLALFKAAQLVRTRSFRNEFRDFTAIDIETTDRDPDRAELVEIAAVQVRDGAIVGEYQSRVRPRVPIAPGAARTHGLSDADVASAPYFEEVWPAFRDFCGEDVLVAHNGHQFDFPILRRMAKVKLCTYDTLPLARDLHPGSAKLGDLAHHFGIACGTSHRALDDARTLARISLALHDAKLARARKTALINLLDYLGLALALSGDEGVDAEGQLLRRLCAPYVLGRYSDCLEFYGWERERAGDSTLPTVTELVAWFGGEKVMQRIRAERTADERYPMAMARLRRLLGQCAAATLGEQISRFLEYVALSRSDGVDPEHERINLLTLHSTKGLEFSRVYILGVEDAQLPGGSVTKAARIEEIEEARRLLYVGMTRAKDRLVLTRVERRGGQPSGGHRFLDEMGVTPRAPA
jgi:ATP-dependent DNA helicase UvrD/PcrA